MEPVYRETVRRWMKWIVSAKSGTSLEREIKKRIDITLPSLVSYRIFTWMRYGIMGIPD